MAKGPDNTEKVRESLEACADDVELDYAVLRGSLVVQMMQRVPRKVTECKDPDVPQGANEGVLGEGYVVVLHRLLRACEFEIALKATCRCAYLQRTSMMPLLWILL